MLGKINKSPSSAPIQLITAHRVVDRMLIGSFSPSSSSRLLIRWLTTSFSIHRERVYSFFLFASTKSSNHHTSFSHRHPAYFCMRQSTATAKSMYAFKLLLLLFRLPDSLRTSQRVFFAYYVIHSAAFETLVMVKSKNRNEKTKFLHTQQQKRETARTHARGASAQMPIEK